jgi:hypothetical protein
MLALNQSKVVLGRNDVCTQRHLLHHFINQVIRPAEVQTSQGLHVHSCRTQHSGNLHWAANIKSRLNNVNPLLVVCIRRLRLHPRSAVLRVQSAREVQARCIRPMRLEPPNFPFCSPARVRNPLLDELQSIHQ